MNTDPRFAGERPKPSPFYSRQKELNIREAWSIWNGYKFAAGERPKPSPFYPRQKELNIREAWSIWNGYKFADYYYDAEYEYFCIRNLCGTYDTRAATPRPC
jgi:hypothetical protein